MDRLISADLFLSYARSPTPCNVTAIHERPIISRHAKKPLHPEVYKTPPRQPHSLAKKLCKKCGEAPVKYGKYCDACRGIIYAERKLNKLPKSLKGKKVRAFCNWAGFRVGKL